MLALTPLRHAQAAAGEPFSLGLMCLTYEVHSGGCVSGVTADRHRLWVERGECGYAVEMRPHGTRAGGTLKPQQQLSDW